MERLMDQTFYASDGGVLECGCGEGGAIRRADPGFYRLLGYSREEFKEKFQNKLAYVLFPEDSMNEWEKFKEEAKRQGVTLKEFRLLCREEESKWIVLSSRYAGEDAVPYIYCMYHDVSKNKQKQIFVQEQALKDPLTGLFNKKTVETMIDAYLKDGEGAAALLVIDIDNFKGVNDSFGHIYGDSVLMDMAAHLKRVSRSSDLVGRVGGDEFVAFFTNIQGKDGILRKAREIGKMFYRAFEETDIRYEISGSIGISFYPDDGKSYLELFDKADVAAYFSKNNGKNQYTIYQKHMIHRNMQTTESEQLELENQLALYRKASRGGTFLMRLDQEYTLLYANDIYYQVLEYTKDLMREKTGNQVKECIHPKDRAFVERIIEEALEHGESVIEWEMRVLTGQGNIRWIQVNGSFEYREKENVMSGFILDNTEKHELKARIAREEERYHIALSQTHMNVWEYDIKRQRILPTGEGGNWQGYDGMVENVPESLIQNGTIHPDSHKDFLELYERISRGDRQAEADIRIRAAGKKGWRWEHEVYTVMFDLEGRPDWAIAVGEDITEQKEAQINYQRELQMRYAVSEGVLVSCRANLSKNEMEFMQQEGSLGPPVSDRVVYDEIMEAGAEWIANADDRERYLQIFSRKALMERYRKGKFTVSLESRWKGNDGKLRWICISTRLVEDAVTKEIYAYGSTRDIDEQKRMELALQQRAERDKLTGAYHKDTAVIMMDEAIRRSKRMGTEFALVAFGVDHYRRLGNRYGYAEAENVLKELSSLLEMKFGNKFIAGRFFEDELLILLQDTKKTEDIYYKSEDIRQSVRMSYMFAQFKIPVTLSVGIVLSEDGIGNTLQGYEKAKRALDEARANGRDQCVLFSRIPAKQESMGAPNPLEANGELKEAGENTLLRCAVAITSSADFEMALELTLEHLAGYFCPERVYLLTLDTSGERIQYIREWKAEQAVSRTQMPVSILTPVKNVGLVEDLESIRLTYPGEYGVMKAQRIRNFLVAALDEEHSGTIGYLGVDNAQRHVSDIAVLQTVRQFLSYDIMRRSLQQKQEYLSYHDSLTGLLNRNSYLSYREGVSEDALLSFGAVSVDINGLKQMNAQYGHSYGDYMVKFTAKMMGDTFRDGRVYRFAGDEFLSLFENMSQDAFYSCVETFKKEMEKSYPSSVSVGAFWTDTDIQVESAISHADERMVIAKQEYYRKSRNLGKRHDPKAMAQLQERIQEGRFRMYLQPKAEISTGRITGAEALVRFAEEDGKIFGPDQFIPQLEMDGSIRYVDLFMFEEVCRILKKWEERGVREITVSMNFSRTSLMEEDLVERIEEIYQKYKVNRRFIEVEVTESSSAGERESIVAMSKRLAELGYRIALDDFGAKYSNMSILSAMELNVLKLDKSLVNDLFSNSRTRVVVKNFLLTCRQLGIESVAEGVESREQLEVLEQLGCDYAQGYYFNKPIPEADFEAFYMR